MRTMAVVACALLAACGGKLADEGDAGDGGATDAIAKKDAKTLDAAKDVQPPPPGTGLNVSGEGPGYESEDQIAVSPNGTILIMWSAFTQTPPYVSMSYSFSQDDGKTFSPPQPIAPPGGLFPGDPAITVDPSGNFWAAYLGIAYSGQSVSYSRVYVAEAPFGTTTFGPPIEISAPNNTTALEDHPKIFATRTGALLVGWADYPSLQIASGNGIVARSDNGTTWTRTTMITQPEAVFSTFFWFCEGSPQSGVYTTFLEATQSQMFVGLRTSLDDGKTFSTTSVVASQPNDQVAALDPGCAAAGNDVWVMYATTNAPAVDETTLDPADHLWLAHSFNGGASFEATHREMLDKQASTLATIPLIAIDDSGKLDVAYIAGNSDGDTNGSIRFSRADSTSTYKSESIDAPTTFDLSRTDQGWLGDYFGGVTHGGSFYLAYPRNETGLDHIYFAKKAVP